jgi:hypothetical protein
MEFERERKRERERDYRKKRLDDVHKIFRKNELPKHKQCLVTHLL